MNMTLSSRHRIAFLELDALEIINCPKFTDLLKLWKPGDFKECRDTILQFIITTRYAEQKWSYDVCSEDLDLCLLIIYCVALVFRPEEFQRLSSLKQLFTANCKNFTVVPPTKLSVKSSAHEGLQIKLCLPAQPPTYWQFRHASLAYKFW
uniref:Uncharacterized protein n=1 Tax=Oryza punctata TaxID=4537 RepID=A0A0E0L1W9_ORYPU